MIEEIFIDPTIDDLVASLCNWRHLSFQVGKYGRVDRFVLQRVRPGYPPIEMLDADTQPGDETLDALKKLDALVVAAKLEVCYNNPRDLRYAYCFWRSPSWVKGGRLPQQLVSQLYARRIEEQERLLAGTLKRGHRAFGFFPLDGYR